MVPPLVPAVFVDARFSYIKDSYVLATGMGDGVKNY
jgi:hypothetical protein